jgi:hypothetical protein
VNAKLLRALLTHVTDNPALLDPTTYGEFRPSGQIAADIAGRALLLSGWTLNGDKTFRSPDGSREISCYWEIEDEAQALLDLTDDELWAGSDYDRLFSILGREEAVRRLRELTEQAEATAGALAAQVIIGE